MPKKLSKQTLVAEIANRFESVTGAPPDTQLLYNMARDLLLGEIICMKKIKCTCGDPTCPNDIWGVGPLCTKK